MTYLASNRQLPSIVAMVNQLPYDYLDGHGIDFEPYDEFLSLEKTQAWLKEWTGNEDAPGDRLAIFGQDGSGGYVAFWITDVDKPLTTQPVVFLSSKGECAVISSNFCDYLWLLAGNHGAREAFSYACDGAGVNESFAVFASMYAKTPKRSPITILRDAQLAHPAFASWINELRRQLK